MKILQYTVGVLCIVSTTLPPYAGGQDAPCRTPLGDTGSCVSLKRCPDIVSFSQKLSIELAKQYATDLRKVCGNQKSADHYPVLCCTNVAPDTAEPDRSVPELVVPRAPPLQPPTASRPVFAPAPAPLDLDHRLPTEEERCGISKLKDKIIGGQEAVPHSWPWMALIGYHPFSANPFRCGGTLINSRHVLTAAHCLQDDITFVRLGEHDIRHIDAPNRVDINVAKVIGYPQYNSQTGRGDIALLVLESRVRFTEHIYPICAPFSTYLRDKKYLHKSTYVAGWGRTNITDTPSPVLKQLQITIIDNAECRRVYKANNRLFSEDQFDDSIFCATYTGSDSKGDSCQGDSGGPLMIQELYKGVGRFYLIGIVSYGIGCAEAGIPSIYTRVPFFRDWINQQVATS